MAAQRSVRCLGSLRISDLSEESTSLERQREKIRSQAESRGWELVGIAEDADVSGAVSPFDRPGLGEWLKSPEDFDVILVWKMDRLSRSVRNFHDLLGWGEEHDVRFWSVEEGNLSEGILPKILAIFAEAERDVIRERVTQSRAHLRKVGRWAGGTPPYGYWPVKITDGFALEPDPESSVIVREIVSRLLGGDSITNIARDLNGRGVLSPWGHQAVKRGRTPKRTYKWSVTGIRQVVTSSAMLGELQHQDKPIRGEDGLPVKIAEPIVSREDYVRLQALIDSRKSRTGLRRDDVSYTLRGIARCICGGPMHGNRSNQYRYYRCSDYLACHRGRHDGDHTPECHSKAWRMEVLESAVVGEFLRKVGHLEHQEKRFIPGEDHTAELQEVDQAIAELDDERFIHNSITPERYRSMQERLQTRRQALATLPQRRAETVWEPTGKTVAEVWERLDPAEHGGWLRHFGVEAVVIKRDIPFPVGIAIPEDVEERLRTLQS